MDEGHYREKLQLRRLFGPGAVLVNEAGSGRGPGSVRIVINGKTVGSGRTFTEAMADATRQARETCWPAADVQLI